MSGCMKLTPVQQMELHGVVQKLESHAGGQLGCMVRTPCLKELLAQGWVMTAGLHHDGIFAIHHKGH